MKPSPKFILGFAVLLALVSIVSWRAGHRGTASGEERAEAKPELSASKRDGKFPAQGPKARGTEAGAKPASAGLLAIRDAITSKDPGKLHSHIQKFERGEFQEVWALLLTLPDGGWKDEEMALAISRAGNLGLLDEALRRIQEDIPAGARRELLLRSAFGSMGTDFREMAGKADAYQGGEREAAYGGLANRLSRFKSTGEIDPAWFENSPPDLQKALAEGLGRLSGAYTTFTTDAEKNAKMADALAFAERMAATGRMGEDFLPDMIGTLSEDRVMQVWDYLQEARPGLVESDPRIFNPVLRSMVGQAPERLMELSVERAWIGSSHMRAATSNWLSRDAAKAEAWLEANGPSLTEERHSQVAAGFADYHLYRGQPNQAREWIGKITDPKLREQLHTIADRGGIKVEVDVQRR